MATFLKLKQDALQGYKPRTLVQGTVPTQGGTTTVFYDNSRQEPQGTWDRVDAYLRLTSGTNNGLERRVTGWSAGNSSLAFAPAVTASVPSGATYDLYMTFNDSDQGLAVNSALRDMAPERVIQSVATAAETQDARFLSVPSAAYNAIAKLTKVERSVGTTNSDYNYEEKVEGYDYRAVPNNDGTLRLETGWIQASGHLLRFTYQRPVAELSANTDTTDEPPSLIVLGARKYLALQEGDQVGVERWGREFESAKSDYYKERRSKRLKIPWISVL